MASQPSYAFAPPTDIDSVSALLESIFLFYAQTTAKSTLLSLNRFQRMCLDADIIDQGQTSTLDTGLTSAQVDLIFKSVVAQGSKQSAGAGQRYMNLQQFMDAIVLLATTKFRDQAQNPRQAVIHLYSEHFLTFQADPPVVSNEWLQKLEAFALPLFHVYKHYFPLELNPHYKVTPAESRDNTHSSFTAIMSDFEIAGKLTDQKPIIFHALRIAYNEPIPQRLVQAIRLDRMGHFSGQFFTFHHFLVAIQCVANTMARIEKKMTLPKDELEEEEIPEKRMRFSAQAIRNLETLLIRMEESKRAQAPQIRLVNDAQAASKMSIDNKGGQELGIYNSDKGKEIKNVMGMTFDFYVTLGEPLQQHLSIRKFNRFLRDVGLVSAKGQRKIHPSVAQSTDRRDAGGRDGTEAEGIVRSVHNMQPMPQFSVSKTPVSQGGHDIDSPRKGQMLSTSPRKPHHLKKVPLDSGVSGNKDVMKVPGLPLRTDMKISSVTADLIFYQAKHDKKGLTQRQEDQADPSKKLGASVSLASLSEGDSRTKQLPATYLDLDGFCRACELLSEKLYKARAGTRFEAVQSFKEDMLEPLLQALRVDDLPNAASVARVVDWQDSPSDIEATNRVFAQVKLPLERVYSTYVANGEPGWSLQTYTDFVEEFGVLRDLKMLTVHRIFYALSDMPEYPPRTHMTFEPFAKSLVYLAQWAIEGEYQTHEKLLLLFHRMNATPGAVKLTHNFDLFNVVAEIREIHMPIPSQTEAPKWAAVMQGK